MQILKHQCSSFFSGVSSLHIAQLFLWKQMIFNANWAIFSPNIWLGDMDEPFVMNSSRTLAVLHSFLLLTQHLCPKGYNPKTSDRKVAPLLKCPCNLVLYLLPLPHYQSPRKPGKEDQSSTICIPRLFVAWGRYWKGPKGDYSRGCVLPLIAL